MDLSEANATALREAFSRYVFAGRKVSGTTKGRTHRTAIDGDPAAVHAWAASNGMMVTPRGRIKAEVLEAFEAAGN